MHNVQRVTSENITENLMLRACMASKRITWRNGDFQPLTNLFAKILFRAKVKFTLSSTIILLLFSPAGGLNPRSGICNRKLSWHLNIDTHSLPSLQEMVCVWSTNCKFPGNGNDNGGGYRDVYIISTVGSNMLGLNCSIFCTDGLVVYGDENISRENGMTFYSKDISEKKIDAVCRGVMGESRGNDGDLVVELEHFVGEYCDKISMKIIQRIPNSTIQKCIVNITLPKVAGQDFERFLQLFSFVSKHVKEGKDRCNVLLEENKELSSTLGISRQTANDLQAYLQHRENELLGNFRFVLQSKKDEIKSLKEVSEELKRSSPFLLRPEINPPCLFRRLQEIRKLRQQKGVGGIFGHLKESANGGNEGLSGTGVGAIASGGGKSDDVDHDQDDNQFNEIMKMAKTNNSQEKEYTAEKSKRRKIGKGEGEEEDTEMLVEDRGEGRSVRVQNLLGGVRAWTGPKTDEVLDLMDGESEGGSKGGSGSESGDDDESEEELL